MDFANYWASATATADLGDTIEQSLRFPNTPTSTENAVLTRTSITFSTWTASFWVKYAGLANGYIFSQSSSEGFRGGNSTSDSRPNYFVDSNHRYLSGEANDPSAWYHYVISYDGSNIKVYVNGTLDLTYATSNGGISLNRIGGYNGSIAFSGYLAAFYWVDGSALLPTSFGKYNNDGVWVPQDYSGTYGTNGFHLTFDSSQTNGIGHDSSGNGNHWTASGFDTGDVALYSKDLFTSTNTSIDVSSTDTNFASGSGPGFAFDGNTTLAANTSATTNSAIVFRPSTPLSNVTQIEVNYSAAVAGTIGGYNGGNETSAAASGYNEIYNGSAITVNNIYVRNSSQTFLSAIRINGSTVLTDNTDNDVDYFDTPTSNYATLNSVLANGTTELVNANLKTQSSSGYKATAATCGYLSSGSWFWQVKREENGGYAGVIAQVDGEAPQNFLGTSGFPAYSIGLDMSTYSGKAAYYYNATATAGSGHVSVDYGSTSVTANSIVVVRLDIDNTRIAWDIDGTTGAWVDYSTHFGDVPVIPYLAGTTTMDVSHNFGQMPFIYTAPTGYKELQTNNLPEPTIKNGKDHFQTILGEGDSNPTSLSSGQVAVGGFSNPVGYLDNNSSYAPFNAFNGQTSGFYFVPRENAHHAEAIVFDEAKTGTTFRIYRSVNQGGFYVNGTFVSGNGSGWLDISSNVGSDGLKSVGFIGTTTAQDGFSAIEIDSNVLVDLSILPKAQAAFTNGLWWIKDRANSNQHQFLDSVRGSNLVWQSPSAVAETTYSAPSGSSVAWCWNAGGSAVTNTDGSITSQVAANTDAGFSIVSYTGNTSSNQTIGHGLNQAPEFIIFKNLDLDRFSPVYHAGLATPNNEYLILHADDPATAGGGANGMFNNQSPTASVIHVGTALSNTNGNGNDMIAYCWHSVPGYSAFGSYTGNANADGPFIYTGFRPAFVLLKNASSTSTWWRLHDSSRNVYNPTQTTLSPNQTGIDANNDPIDFLSNGFKIRNSREDENKSGSRIVYVAFAENPFGGENTAPATAR